jgi:hypothetical protein
MGAYGWSYFRRDTDRWWRLFGFQLGFHTEGRHRLFSERYGYRRGPLTFRVGRRAEVSFRRLTNKSDRAT